MRLAQHRRASLERCKGVHLARQRLEQALWDLAVVDREDDIRSQSVGLPMRRTRGCRGNCIGSLSPLVREWARELRSGGLLCSAATADAGEHHERQRQALH
jgi:hypothetical protein